MTSVCIASAGLGHVNRGIEVWANSMASALNRRGCEVALCRGAAPVAEAYECHLPCLQRNAITAKWLVRLMPKRFFWRLGFGSTYAVEQTTFALRLMGYLRRKRFDVLHVQDPPVARLVQWAQRNGLLSTRTILGHGTDEPLDYLQNFDFLQHLSPYHLEEAKQRYCWKPTWTAIPNFVDTQRFAPRICREVRQRLGLPIEATVVMTAAAITKEVKRVDRLLAEFKTLIDETGHGYDIRLLIAGSRTHDTASLIQEGEAQLGDKVRFLVDVAAEEMPALYNAADVFVLASDREMMPIALLEAIASGLPCIVNQADVLRWMIGPGGSAIDMSTVGRLSQEMKHLVSNQELRWELGRSSRRHCLENFSEDSIIDQMLAYYDFVAGYQLGSRSVFQAAVPGNMAQL